MMLYETDENRVRQHYAADAMRLWIEINPFVGHKAILHETLRGDACSWDCEVFIGGLLYAIAEIKSRSIDHAFVMKHGWLVERERLVALWKAQKAMDVPACMICHTSDDRVGYVTLATLERYWKQLPDAPASMMKNNNGADPAPEKSGKLVSGDLIQWVR